jgi:hypothetical protein
MDFSNALLADWGEQPEEDKNGDDLCGLEKGEEVLQVEVGLVANGEFRDERWLFDPENEDSPHWIEANTLEELKVVTDTNMTFIQPGQPLPPNSKPLPIILIYTRKRADSSGKSRFKCRSVVLGNLENSNLPNFAPVISIPGVRLLITEAIASGSGIDLFDLTNAFLGAELTAEDGNVVVRLPNSWAQRRGSQYAVLKRALYGLRISPKRWYETISAYLKQLGWEQTANCLFVKVVDGERIWMSLYVDDVVMGGSTTAIRRIEIQKIFDKFPGKMIEPVKLPNGAWHYDVNGIECEVNYSEKSFLMHMNRYIEGIVTKFNMKGAAPCTHPKINPELIQRDQAVSNFPVRECLGALIWCSSTCRPDIVYDVNILARFVGVFGATEGTASACKKILKYLSGTARQGINYSPQREKEFQKRYMNLIEEQCATSEFGTCDRDAKQFSKKVFVFSDASFASCPLTLKSQTGSCVYYRGVLICYKSGRQTVLSHSTCASEYIACSDTLSFLTEVEPHLNLFDAPPVGTMEHLIPVFVDNQSAIRISRNDVLNNASKHLKLRHMRVTEASKRLFFCGTKEQEADSFTKSLGEEIFAMWAKEHSF